MAKRLIVGLTGATGTVYGVRLLERLRELDVETHLVISRWGARTLSHETPYSREHVESLATVVYPPGDMGAAISSGSFKTDGMIVAPCSAKTLAAIAHGFGDNLIHRAADVILKERRRLLLAIREAPLSEIHLENMLKLSRMGAVILPPVPAFYNHPRTIDDVVDHTVARMLDAFGLEVRGAVRLDRRYGCARGLDFFRGLFRARERAFRVFNRLGCGFGFCGEPSRELPRRVRFLRDLVEHLLGFDHRQLGVFGVGGRFLQRGL
jgi:4-hydroxy-3-polyprenylbenzoate decarboxylase